MKKKRIIETIHEYTTGKCDLLKNKKQKSA